MHSFTNLFLILILLTNLVIYLCGPTYPQWLGEIKQTKAQASGGLCTPGCVFYHTDDRTQYTHPLVAELIQCPKVNLKSPFGT